MGNKTIPSRAAGKKIVFESRDIFDNSSRILHVENRSRSYNTYYAERVLRASRFSGLRRLE
jgi:hypothetical protein